ncbi:hypothetical protein ABZS66_34665 [Dactylosporangium sp. NPDC005572]|uniref:hypothetical protein n=1 Tax=Dactylosporangium sp. NPDC005572 TaxID=3156889 RepID=UPI0033BAA998
MVRLRAVGRVLRRTRRVAFCAASPRDADGVTPAENRCTQVVLLQEFLKER